MGFRWFIKNVIFYYIFVVYLIENNREYIRNIGFLLFSILFFCYNSVKNNCKYLKFSLKIYIFNIFSLILVIFQQSIINFQNIREFYELCITIFNVWVFSVCNWFEVNKIILPSQKYPKIWHNVYHKLYLVFKKKVEGDVIILFMILIEVVKVTAFHVLPFDLRE